MKTLKEYKTYLFNNGYKINDDGFPYGYINDELSSVEFVNKDGKSLVLSCHHTEELNKYLKENYQEGEECPIDDTTESMIVVDSAMFESSIVNMPDFMNGSKPGIFLQERSLLDDGGYYKDGMDLFTKCVWIQNNELEHSKNIMEQHFRNVDFFNKYIKSILEIYDYRFLYTSILDIEEKDTSSPIFEYGLKNAFDCYNLIFVTDCITGEFSVSVPFGTFDEESSVEFVDILTNFDRKAFMDAVNNSCNRFNRLYSQKEEVI